MIKLYADYHTHTLYSHGKGTIMDNVMAARRKGLTEVAITDHGIGHISFGVKPRHLKKMRDEIDSINANVKGIKVLLGMECNIISSEGDIDITDDLRKYIDILLVGFHMMATPKSLRDAYHIYGKHYMSKLLPGIRERVREANSIIMGKAIQKNKIDIITHPGARIPVDTTYIAGAAAKYGTIMEINASTTHMTAEQVRSAAGQGVKFSIDSDAHRPEDVGNFERGLKVAIEGGLDSSQIINAIK